MGGGRILELNVKGYMLGLWHKVYCSDSDEESSGIIVFIWLNKANLQA